MEKGYDYKNTAGWKLMQHEENLKKMLNRKKGAERHGSKGNTERKG